MTQLNFTLEPEVQEVLVSRTSAQVLEALTKRMPAPPQSPHTLLGLSEIQRLFGIPRRQMAAEIQAGAVAASVSGEAKNRRYRVRYQEVLSWVLRQEAEFIREREVRSNGRVRSGEREFRVFRARKN